MQFFVGLFIIISGRPGWDFENFGWGRAQEESEGEGKGIESESWHSRSSSQVFFEDCEVGEELGTHGNLIIFFFFLSFFSVVECYGG